MTKKKEPATADPVTTEELSAIDPFAGLVRAAPRPDDARAAHEQMIPADEVLVNFTVRVSKRLRRKVKKDAELMGMSVQDYMSELLEWGLKRSRASSGP